MACIATLRLERYHLQLSNSITGVIAALSQTSNHVTSALSLLPLCVVKD
jgi:hypothetical protein